MERLKEARERWTSARTREEVSTDLHAATPLASLVTLACWRLRQNWGLPILVGVGMLFSTILVCAVPLYALVAMSAGARQVFVANPPQDFITVNGQAALPVLSSSLNNFIEQINNDMMSQVGSGIIQQPQFSLQTTFALSGNDLPDHQQYDYSLKCVSYDPRVVASAVQLLQGKLPQLNKNAVEMLLTPEEASLLHAHVGSLFTAPLSYQYTGVDTSTTDTRQPLPQTLTFQVAGIFQVRAPGDIFWHGQSFTISTSLEKKEMLISPVIVANDGILNAFDSLNTQASGKGETLSNNASVAWYYPIAIDKLSILNLSSVASGLAKIQADVNNGGINAPNGVNAVTVEGVQIFVPGSLLTSYLEHVSAAIVPVALLTLLLSGLALFFVNQMCGLLIERQMEMIALLRSRGASQRQIFGMFALQGLLLAMAALILGPLLALPLARGMAAIFLRGGDLGAIHLIEGNPFIVAWSVRWYALATALAAAGAMMLALALAARLDLQQVRNETTRARRRSLLQRIRWDAVMLIFAITIYGTAFYMLNTGVLDAQLTTLWLSPLSILAAICIVLAGAFLLLRLLPRLLNLLARLAARSRGAALLLGLTQIARTPRQTLRTLLLLLLTTAFATFTLLFFATQGQRIPSVAAYQAGADFSGSMITPPVGGMNMTPEKLITQVRDRYQHIPGVLSASAGYVAAEEAQGTTISIEVHAIDTETFAQSTLWLGSGVDEATMNSLMSRLRAQRAQALSQNILPAIVDAATWNALHLQVGTHFTLTEENGALSYIVLAEVPHIPTITDSATGTDGGGILVDYISYARLYTRTSGNAFPLPSTVWLRAGQSSASLNAVRAALSQGPLQLEPLYDREALARVLNADPLYLTLAGILAAGTAMALLLALLGSLLTSWFSTGIRLTNFAVLRALGSTPRQVAQVMAWEQGSIYLLAIGLGMVAGIIFSFLAVPLLVFTGTAATGIGSTTSGNSFFVLQSAPPIQIIFPPSLPVAILLLCAFCTLALTLVVRLIARASLGTVLRLNAD